MGAITHIVHRKQKTTGAIQPCSQYQKSSPAAAVTCRIAQRVNQKMRLGVTYGGGEGEGRGTEFQAV